ASLVRFRPSTARWPHVPIIASERAAGRLKPYFEHLMVPIDPSPSARSLISRALTAPSTCHGVLPRGANPTSLMPGYRLYPRRWVVYVHAHVELTTSHGAT